MPLDVYRRADIRCILEAVWIATEGASQGSAMSEEYKQGVRNTIVSVGTVFGLVSTPQVGPVAKGQSAPLLLASAPYEP